MENITIELNNLTEAEREHLMALIKKANAPKRWMPKCSETYYAVTSACRILSGQIWNDDQTDKGRYEINNVFRTEEEAKEEATRRKILAKWKRLSIEAGEEENTWGSKENKMNLHWYVYYSPANGELGYDYAMAMHREGTYFPTKESIMAAVEEIGEADVKKYILGVKE